MEILIILLIIVFFILMLMYLQTNNNKIENFKSNTLIIKQTQNYDKVFENSKYTVWIPKPINDYYPIGNYITLDKNPPNTMALLVKNNIGLESNDKPIKYEIVSITNKNYAIWKPIGADNYISLGNIYSKEYPSKYLIRTIPSKFCEKSSVNNRLIKNKISKVDKGYELWGIQDSNLFICNNLNNYNLENIKKVYKIKENSLSIEKKLYIKTINSYKKICSYTDPKINKKFYIWRPVTPNNFCSLGDIILKTSENPNNKLDTIVVHKSFCKIPLNYGNKSISKIKTKSKNINFWRPIPHNDYYFFGDIVVIGDDQPEADNLIYSVSVDYIKQIQSKTHNMIYNNISENDSISIWSDNNHFFSVINSYSSPVKNNYVLNMKFTESDVDLSDIRTELKITYKSNNNLKKLSNNDLLELIKTNLSNKIDIRMDRLNDISINDNMVILNIEPKKTGSNEITINKCIEKLNSHIEIEPIKIYNSKKTDHYISLLRLFNTEEKNIIEIDNSHFKKIFA
jgi:hypothetical protein